MKRRTQIVSATLVLAFICGAVGCGGAGRSTTAENAQASPRLTSSQEAQVRRILLANISHYAQLVSQGQRALGTTQYPNAQVGLNAFSDPNSAANRFGAYQKDANVYGSASYLEAFNRADRFFAVVTEPQAMTNWEDDMAQAQGDLARWINDAISWQISEVQTSVLQADLAAIGVDFAKARADAIRATPGASRSTSSSTSLTTSTASSNPSSSSVPSWVQAAKKGCPAGEVLLKTLSNGEPAPHGNDGCVVDGGPYECSPSEPTCDPANAPGGTPTTQTTTPTTVPAPESHGFVRCPNATLESGGQAKVAILSGPATCSQADRLVSDAIGAQGTTTTPRADGMWSWHVGDSTCTSGGDGTISTCVGGGPGVQASKIIATTPTPGGYWPDPVP